MSIDHLKKRAKNLSRLLPDHLKTHEKPEALAACQELAACVDGYPSWHAAMTRKDLGASAAPNASEGSTDALPALRKAFDDLVTT